MADTKISAMTSAGSLTGTEIVPIVQSGANKSTTAQAIANLAGGVVSSGTISSAVPYLDITIPSHPDCFDLSLAGFRLSDGDNLVMALSFDGGTTFLNDVNNWDSYRWYWPNNTEHIDAVIALCRALNSNFPLVKVSLFPGNSLMLASLIGEAVVTENQATASVMAYDAAQATVNPTATVTPIAARATTIRLQAYGSGNVNVQPGTVNLIAGAWSLIAAG
jgi:hypothetical protein